MHVENGEDRPSVCVSHAALPSVDLGPGALTGGPGQAGLMAVLAPSVGLTERPGGELGGEEPKPGLGKAVCFLIFPPR